MSNEVCAALALLGLRPGACVDEVRRAFRSAVRKHRPDLGQCDGDWVAAVTAARDTLLRAAGPDRRRRRGTAVAGTSTLFRRATWRPDAPDRPTLDLTL